MLRAGGFTLLALVLFSLVFAFLPSGKSPTAETGARLQGVSLTLYPARDPAAIWRFKATDVVSNPVSGETKLSGLSDGGRWVKVSGTPDLKLDATLSAPELTIDAQDNLMTPSAKITLVEFCADIDLKGNAKQPVRIEQGYGFIAPRALLDSPEVKGDLKDLKMTFQFGIDYTSPSSQMNASLDGPTEVCKDGQRVPYQP